MDEELQQTPAQNEGPEAGGQSDSPTDESTYEPSQAEGPEQREDASEQADEPTDDAERKPNRAERRGAERENRIRELSGKVRQMEQSSQLPQGYGMPQVPTLQPGQEIDPQEYQNHVVQAAQSIANFTVQNQLAQDRAVQNVDRDTELLPTRYPELNPESSDYSPELEKAIAEEFQEKAFRVAGYDQRTGQPIYTLNPSVRLADVAKRYTDVARAAANKSPKVYQQQKQTQTDTGGIRPTGGSSRGETEFKDLSIADMEAKLGFHGRR